MLQVVNDGVIIQLDGKTHNRLFALTIGLIITAIITAIIAMTMPTPFAIGAMAFFATLIFGFNLLTQKDKQHITLSSGQLHVTPHQLTHQKGVFCLSDKAVITQSDNTLTISDPTNISQTIIICGFHDLRHLDITQQILRGKKIAKNHVAIKLQSK